MRYANSLVFSGDDRVGQEQQIKVRTQRRMLKIHHTWRREQLLKHCRQLTWPVKQAACHWPLGQNVVSSFNVNFFSQRCELTDWHQGRSSAKKENNGCRYKHNTKHHPYICISLSFGTQSLHRTGNEKVHTHHHPLPLQSPFNICLQILPRIALLFFFYYIYN